MKILVVHGGPDAESFSSALAHEYVGAATRAGHTVEFVDLAREGFDPVLRHGYRARMPADPLVERSQSALMWCEHVALVFPTWWAGEPSVLKGWFDRVLTPEIAYEYRPDRTTPTRLLGGRTATLVTTCHAPLFYARWNAAYPPRRIGRHVLGYCGIRTTRRLILGSMDGKTDTPERRGRFLADVRRAATDP